MDATVLLALSVPTAMIVGWLIHIAVCWKWDFEAWYHDSDNDL